MDVYNWSRVVLLAALGALLAGCQSEAPDAVVERVETEAVKVVEDAVEANSFTASVMEWRERRIERLTQPYSWLSLVGYYALDREGSHSLGSAGENDIVVPGGPEVWGQIVLTGDTVTFESADTERVLIDDEPVASAELLSSAFTDDDPTRIESDDVRVQLSRSGGIPNLRVRSPDAASLTGFVGIDYYEPDPAYRFEAEFIPHEAGKTMRVANVLGQIIDEDNPGIVRFEHDGVVFELETFLYGERLFMVFADRTSGNETYGLGRFLYAELPVDGKTIVDFNEAYNPPCAFTEYTTCSMPPQQNRMDTRILAGEKTYRGQPGMTKDNLVQPAESI
ncbi:MAG: DUF1684 domain-containing protein [Pseudomonadota bacterium]